MDLSDLFLAVAIALGVLVLIGALIIGYVMWRFKVPPRGVVAMFVALGYLATPIDVLPEAILGPFGLIDDAGVVTGVAFFVYRLVRARNALRDGGVIGNRRDRPPV
ncbi:hypothetical protein BH09ACT12_BH09ACT12_14000 [soil metagenome]